MGIKKIGGFIFKSFATDHPPRHVHIYYEGRELGKFDVENQKLMDKRLRITGKLRKALKEAEYLK